MNFIFDLGNILIEWNKDKILSQLVEEKDIPIFEKHIFQSNLWRDLDQGLLSLEELEEILCQRIGMAHQKEIRKIVWHWPEYVTKFPNAYSLIERLKKQGEKIYILSNTSPLFYRMLEKELAQITPLLDGFLLSCEVGILKPSSGIYEKLLDKYGLAVEECLFFDDLPENVKAARELGIESYQISSESELLERLTDYSI